MHRWVVEFKKHNYTKMINKKVMILVFRDANVIFAVDYLMKGKTINSPYYYNFLDQLNEKSCEERPC